MASGSAYLQTAVNVTGTAALDSTAIVTFTIPSAGKWNIEYFITMDATGAGQAPGYAALFSSDTTVIPNSEIIGSNNSTVTTASGRVLLTTTKQQTFKLKGWGFNGKTYQAIAGGKTGVICMDTMAGPQGIQGIPGPQGPIGLTGPKGDTGRDGQQGPQGPIGATGAAGPKGDKGDTGSQGPKGETGATGAAGAAGAAGVSYTPGPAFIATITTGQNLPTSPSSVSQYPLIYNSVSKNIGNGYNSTSGIFTAPITGFYQVSGSISINLNVPLTLSILSADAGGALGLYKNGSPISSGQFITIQGFSSGGIINAFIDSSSLSTLVYLNSGDTLQCKLVYFTNLPNNYLGTLANLVASNFQAVWIRP